MLAPRGWADLQVGGEVVASLVLREVGLARGVPACEAGVADPLGRQDLLAVVVLRLGNEDVFKRLGSLLGLLGHLGHVAARVVVQYSLRELSVLTVQLMIND